MFGLKESVIASSVWHIGLQVLKESVIVVFGALILKYLAVRCFLTRKRRSIVSHCCFICDAERSRRATRSYTSRLLKWWSEQRMKKEEEEVDNDDGAIVGLHSCKRQVVITVNAPPDFKLSLDFLPCFQGGSAPYDGWILGTSKGLLLCSSQKCYRREWCATQYYLCDPVSKHWMALPPTPKSMCVEYFGFVFDPCRNFGNPDLHQPLPCNKGCRFKVLRKPEWFSKNLEVEIFSSDVGQWIKVDAGPWITHSVPSTFNVSPPEIGSLFHNGFLYWLQKQHLVVYDPYNNKLRGLVPPPPSSQICRGSTLEGPKLCRGSIWLFQLSSSSKFFRCWELKGSNGKLNLDKCYWRPYRLCDLTETIGDPWDRELLAIHPHNPDVVYLSGYYDNLSSHIVSCNLSTKVTARTMIRYEGGVQYFNDQITIVFPPISKSRFQAAHS